MPVGGSRFYGGGGLGQEGVWGCPSCGEDNSGPIAQGCVHCGAGKPGRRVEEAPPPPPPQPVAATSVWDQWAEANPDATAADAFYQGYQQGYKDAMRHARKRAEETPAFSATGKVTRTIVAALELFRDQVLSAAPDEIASGEWCSTEEITALIHQLREQEAAHAV